MRSRYLTSYSTLRTEGGILPRDIIQRIADGDSSLGGLTPESYHLGKTEKVNEATNRSWNRLVGAWAGFRQAREKLSSTDMGTKATRDQWLLPLFQELGYGRLLATKAIEIEGRQYPISHLWQHAPIHLVGCKVDLDKRTAGVTGAAKISPHSLVQELLNRSTDYLWGFISDGLTLRILRDNKSLTRQAYIEFDLEAMMEGESYSDFILLWLLCHQSRVEADKPEECWLEKWSKAAQDQGIRALERLRDSVQNAISILGAGFLSHPRNTELRRRLQEPGELDKQDYYRQLLRLVYRLLFLLVAEDRELLLDPKADPKARDLYNNYYSISRLRAMAEKLRGTRHSDLFCGLKLVMQKLGSKEGCPELGLPALGSDLFRPSALPDLEAADLSNSDLLEAIRTLTLTVEGRIRRTVDYKNLRAEELGSVYESLLEMHPDLNADAGRFELRVAAGHERKTTGSYYTPESLVQCLLDSALDPVLQEAAGKPNPEEAILKLKVCDPACGSGHFLIAAAHRIAKRLAAVRTGDDEPSPEATRTALRDVIGRCIYGVDLNPDAVELCKVALWIEALEPGKPLSFLEHHIQCGNSLLGTTPALLKKGIPDEAFTAIEGDDKEVCKEYKKRNKKERETAQESLLTAEGLPWDNLGNVAASVIKLDSLADDSIQGIEQKQKLYEDLVKSSGYLYNRFWADTWCAAFVWKKTKEFPYPITEEVFRRIERSPHGVDTWLRDEVIRLRDQYKFFQWHLAFPDVFVPAVNVNEAANGRTGWNGGFDIVLGNPPWERVKIQEKEWFAERRPDITNATNAAARKRAIDILVSQDPPLYQAWLEASREAEGEGQLLRSTGRYPLTGRGDVNTYALFSETNCAILSNSGRVGCIVPTGIATDDTTKFFFQDIVDKGSLVKLFSFENEELVFPSVHHATKFCLLTLCGQSSRIEAGDFVFYLRQVNHLEESQRHFALTAADVALLSPNTRTCPAFRSARDADLTKHIYRRVPVLVNDATGHNPWHAYYMRFVHLGDHKESVCLTCDTVKPNFSVSLYESKLVWHYDHRYSTFEGVLKEDLVEGRARETLPTEKTNPNAVVTPRYLVEASLAQELYAKYPEHEAQWLLVWRDVTSATNERTAVSTIIPSSAPSVSCPGLGHRPMTDTYKLLACINSYCFDYLARQKIAGLHLNWGILKQLPVLRSEDFPLDIAHRIRCGVIELAFTSWDLASFARDCGYDGPPFRWDEERRFLIRCELDATFFHLYGIVRDDVDYIMDTFPIVRKNDEKKHGEYRTKRVILEVYDAMADSIHTGQPYQTIVNPPPADPSAAHPAKEHV